MTVGAGVLSELGAASRAGVDVRAAGVGLQQRRFQHQLRP